MLVFRENQRAAAISKSESLSSRLLGLVLTGGGRTGGDGSSGLRQRTSDPPILHSAVREKIPLFTQCYALLALKSGDWKFLFACFMKSFVSWLEASGGQGPSLSSFLRHSSGTWYRLSPR